MNRYQAAQVVAVTEYLWNEVLDITEHATGIYSVKTISHGGIVIDPARAVTLPEEARTCGAFLFGGWLAFEEDMAAWAVIAALPNVFPPESSGGEAHVKIMAEQAYQEAQRLCAYCQHPLWGKSRTCDPQTSAWYHSEECYDLHLLAVQRISILKGDTR